MALNKSNKSTPSSRSGYFTELTASAGKQSNFLLPVRIKLTPNTTLGPLSDGKKNTKKLLQPVLIKDLFLSSQKDKQNTTISSVSTQKKRDRFQRSTQPYLSTQSCYKPKKEEDTAFFNRKSCGENKVRRQLYQNLESPQKLAFEGKENANKIIKPKRKTTRDSEEPGIKNTQSYKNRKSLLLPPNSIKNNFMNKTGPSGKQSIKNNTITVNKQTKNNWRVTETKKPKNNIKSKVQTEIEADTESNLSSPYISDCDRKQLSCTMKDNFTMTSPVSDKEVLIGKSSSDLNKHEGPSVIISNSKVKCEPELSNNLELPCLKMQNLNINKIQCNCAEEIKVPNETFQNIELDFSKMNNLDYSGFVQFKSFLEQSIEANENQILKLKQMLNFINNIISNTATTKTVSTEIVKNLLDKKECDVPSQAVIDMCSPNITDIVNESVDQAALTDNINKVGVEENEISAKEEESKMKIKEKLPIPLKILVTDADLNQEAKEVSLETIIDMARLSTIGEVSYEVDDSNKDEKDVSENKENINYSFKSLIPSISPRTPKTPRTSMKLDSCDSQNRRRSARIAARRASLTGLSESDKQDSFTLLENELNVEHRTVGSKSLPASPMKPPVTPGVIKQWDKRVERPLKEYMALKMNGTFLVTPDVKRFQSRVDLTDTTDTPHSRKSMSRKIFMELCDLYADSPDSS